MKDAGTIVSMDAGLSVTDQSHGLDWVHWLLRSVRQQCDGLIWPRKEHKTLLQIDWRTFAKERFIKHLSPRLLDAWHAAESRDPLALIEIEHAWAAILNDEEQARSIRAGTLLLKRTNGARYQGVLGHYRTAVQSGAASGHIGIAWPALAHLFQLTPATMLAEYLRLEWETATRELDGVMSPIGSGAFQHIVGRSLSPVPHSPRLLLRRREA